MANSRKTNYHNPNRKSRSYVQIIYEESAPQNFVDLLKAEVDKGKLRYFILSPLHNIDWYTKRDEAYYQKRLILNELDPLEMSNPVKAGTYKKSHWHFIGELTYNNQQYYANKYFQSLTNGSFVEPRGNLRGAVRYLAHLDEDPAQKALYDPDQIFSYGDICIDKFLEDEDKSMTSLAAWKELKELIDDEGIVSLATFENRLLDTDIALQLQVQKNYNLRSRAVAYINSKRSEEMSREGYYAVLARQIEHGEEAGRLLRAGETIDFVQKKLQRGEI